MGRSDLFLLNLQHFSLQKTAIPADKFQRYMWYRYSAIVIILKIILQNECNFRILLVLLRLTFRI